NTALKPSTLPNPQSRSLFPYMISTFYDRSVGFADYHAFQLSVDKRFSSGLAYQVAYTFSKALDENDGFFGAEGKNVADPYNPRASLSPAGYDLPNLVGDPNSGACPSSDPTLPPIPVHTQGCWLNTSALAAPAPGTFGNLRPNAFQAQRYWNVDFSVFRGFPLWAEGPRLEF